MHRSLSLLMNLIHWIIYFFFIETRGIHPPQSTPDGPAHRETVFLFLSYTFLFLGHSRPSSRREDDTEDKLKGYIVHLGDIIFPGQ